MWEGEEDFIHLPSHTSFALATNNETSSPSAKWRTQQPYFFTTGVIDECSGAQRKELEAKLSRKLGYRQCSVNLSDQGSHLAKARRATGILQNGMCTQEERQTERGRCTLRWPTTQTSSQLSHESMPWMALADGARCSVVEDPKRTQQRVISSWTSTTKLSGTTVLTWMRSRWQRDAHVAPTTDKVWAGVATCHTHCILSDRCHVHWQVFHSTMSFSSTAALYQQEHFLLT